MSLLCSNEAVVPEVAKPNSPELLVCGDVDLTFTNIMEIYCLHKSSLFADEGLTVFKVLMKLLMLIANET